jgi:4-carboxymuconolactone decarboxylase
MKRKMTTLFTRVLYLLALFSLVPLAAPAQETLPTDVNADSRNRLPLIEPDAPLGAAGIRLHGSGVAVRWESALGRAMTELAILVTAREHDQLFEWSLHELAGIAVGLDPQVIDVVRNRQPLTGVGEKESVIIQIGREIFREHELSPETYSRALRVLGEANLVDIVDLMGTYTRVGTGLTAFNSQMPPGWKQFLPLPFTPPDDIHPDSRSRLPYVRTQTSNAATPVLYSRSIAPEGTGPAQIRRHGAGRESLERSVGRRLMGLVILVTAREHDAQYQWTMNELAALEDGLEPSIIELVRHRGPVTGLAEKEAVLIEFGRELFAEHNVSSQTYARALEIFGERDLVDFVDLMGQHAGDATLLTAFDQHLPVGQEPLLEIP